MGKMLTNICCFINKQQIENPAPPILSDMCDEQFSFPAGGDTARALLAGMGSAWQPTIFKMPTKGPVSNTSISCCSKRHRIKGTVSKRKHFTSRLFCVNSCWWVSKDQSDDNACKWPTSYYRCWEYIKWADTINISAYTYFWHAKT